MAYAQIALELGKIILVKNLIEPSKPFLTEYLIPAVESVGHGNTGTLLTAMLQSIKTVINRLSNITAG